ncbi:MAG: hypothetical protein CMI02_10405 [Oceanospirillaceae bacterium]|nr:hypothetical protein [Oceanospirillaceae bacterium]
MFIHPNLSTAPIGASWIQHDDDGRTPNIAPESSEPPGNIVRFPSEADYSLKLREALESGDPVLVVQDVSYTFVDRLAPEGKEIEPFMHFYVSQPLSTDVFEKQVNSNGESGSLSFFLRLKSNAPTTVYNTKLNVDLFSEIPNKYGVYCVNQAGSAMIPLADLLKLSREADRRPSGVKVSFRIPASPRVEKGELVLRISKGSVYLRNLSNEQDVLEQVERGVNITKRYGPYMKAEIEEMRVKKMITAYLKQTFQRFQRMRPTWQVIKRIHAYTFVSRVGLTPAQVYHLLPIHKGDPLPNYSMETWKNFIRIALRRDGRLTLEQFERGEYPDDVENADEYSAYIMSTCLTEYVNACKYITDKVDRNDRTVTDQWKSELVELMESFDVVSVRDAGDCEDFAMMMMYQSFILKHILREMRKMPESERDPALFRVAESRDWYYVFANLSGVSSMTLNGDYGRLKSMGAHEYLVLIPRHYYHTMVSTALPLLDSEQQRVIDKSDARSGFNVRVLVCEGTGFLQTDGRGQDPFPNERAMLGNAIRDARWAFKDAHKMFYYSPRGSHFYQTSTSLFTHEFFYRGVPVGEFTMTHLVKPDEPEKESSWVYGTRFTDMINKSGNISMVPQKTMSPELFSYVKMLVEDIHPMRPLLPPKAVPTLPADAETLRLLSEVGRDTVPASQRLSPEQEAVVDYYLRYDQMTSERVDAFIASLRRLGPSVWVDVQEENMCLDRSGLENFGGYHILFHVPQERYIVRRRR